MVDDEAPLRTMLRLMLEREGQEARVWDLGSVTGVQRVPKRRRRLRFDVVGCTPRDSGAQFGASHSL